MRASSRLVFGYTSEDEGKAFFVARLSMYLEPRETNSNLKRTRVYRLKVPTQSAHSRLNPTTSERKFCQCALRVRAPLSQQDTPGLPEHEASAA